MPRYRSTRKQKVQIRRNLTPLWVSLAGLVLLLVAGLALRSVSSPSKPDIEVQGNPKIKVDQQTIDHGEVKLGITISDVIRVTNVGDQTLRFSEAPYIEVLEGC
jgi:hypothetical protein